jgi:glycosyltransferase involved in cell wall biosynthesis
MTALFFSIITPTRNRAKYLPRVRDGLAAQKFRSFEWIVADDGSSDETQSVILELAANCSFQVTYIRADRHVGKIRMDNAAVQRARGHFILWCDSDDWLLPRALECLWETWNSIPTEQRDNYVGLTALAATDAWGAIENPFPSAPFTDVSWNDLAEVHRVTGDMLFCARAEELKAHPFPEIDLVIPESVVWTAIGDRPTRLVPEVLKMVEYQSSHAVSFNGSMSYNRGRAYSLATTTRNFRHYRQTMKTRLWRLINFIRYSLHGEITPYKSRRLWGENSSTFLFWIMFPIALGLAVKDRLQGKVKMTHRKFLAAQDSANFSIKILTDNSIF